MYDYARVLRFFVESHTKMRAKTICFSLLAFLSLSPLSRAQVTNCGSSLNINNGACQTPTCSDVFPRTSLNDCNFSVCDMYVKTTTFCCSLRIRYFSGPGGPCLLANLKDPESRAKVRALAETEDILIPTCGGAYVPASALKQELLPADEPNVDHQRT
jgi:hypothetical protein